MPRRIILPVLMAALALLLVACPAAGTQTGSLTVTITGLPAGLGADVTVTGPDGSQTITTTTTLTDLPVGTYTITATTITSTAVTSEYDPTITPPTVTVTANQTATSTVTYALVAGSLTVTVSGLPPGVDADVTVTSPAGFNQALTATQTLTGIDPGVYSASAQFVTDGTDSYTPTVTGSPAEVSSSTSATIDVAYALEPGSLQLTITGLPAGVEAEVTVTGAGGFSQTVTTTTTLTDLTPGIYALTAETALSSDATVSEAYDVTTPPPATVEVTSNTTVNASTTYAKRPGSGRLWQALTSDPLLDGFTSAQLAASGTPTPDVTLTQTGSESDEAVAFDSAGNAWVTNLSSNTVSRYDAGKLEASATVTPDVTLTSDGTSLAGAVGLAFDAAGNLWVATGAGRTLEMFTPAQLTTSGTPTPTVTIGTDGTSLAFATGIAFDASGNLWVSSFFIGNTLEMFTPTQLTTSGTPTPTVTIGSDGTSLAGAAGIAFDAAGSLWVTSFSSSTLEMFLPALLTTSGTPTPTVTIGSDGTSLAGPIFAAFDNGGNLWVSTNGSDNLEKFTPTQLATSGTPTPSVTIEVNPTDLGGLAFSPPPADLPIHAP